MKKLYVLIFIVSTSCNTHFKNSITPPQIDKDDWTLESTPNNLDVVGVVFGVDSHNNYLRIPGGKLQLKTTSSPTVLSEQRKNKTVSYGAIVNFLKLTTLSDSLGKIEFEDSTKLNLNFSIKEGIITNIDDDIANAFEQQRKVIESNLVTLNLDSTRLFLVLETIQSPNVSILFSRSKATESQAFSKIKNLLNIDGHFQVTSNNNDELSYNLQESLVIFYKLRQINVKVSKIKGEPLQKVELSLGQNLNSDELTIQNK